VVDLLALDLLGGHVVHRAEHQTAPRHRRGLEVGDAKVHDLDLAVRRDPDVGGFHVPMDDAGTMGIAEALADLADDVEFPFDRVGLFLGNHLLEVRALDELHGDVGLPFVLPEVVDGHDVSVAQPSGGLSLTQESGPQVGIVGEPRDHRLESDLSVDEGVDRFVDGPHPAASENRLDLVLADSLQELFGSGLRLVFGGLPVAF
jgi:hypothetical protein